MTNHIIEVNTPTPCFLPENRDIFDQVINLTIASEHRPDSKRRRPWIEAARSICLTCPERNQCLDVHGRDTQLGVIAACTDGERAEFFGATA